MQERKFHEINVNDIAARAEISRTAFCHHYADKFDWPEQTIRENPRDLTVHYIATSTSAFIEWWVRNNTLFSPEQLAQCIYSFHHI